MDQHAVQNWSHDFSEPNDHENSSELTSWTKGRSSRRESLSSSTLNEPQAARNLSLGWNGHGALLLPMPRENGTISIDSMINNTQSCLWTPLQFGWGNAILAVLSGALRLARRSGEDQQSVEFPCVVDYEWGGVIARLFRNLVSCPRNKKLYNGKKCLLWMRGRDDKFINRKRKRRQKHGLAWMRSWAIIEARRNEIPELFELDLRFIENTIFARSKQNITVSQLRTSVCAVHTRFGDAFSRTSTTKQVHTDDRKVCQQQSESKECFECLSHNLLRENCPDPNLSMYVASDLPEFLLHFCNLTQPEHQPNITLRRQVVSSCSDTGDDGLHILDVPKKKFKQALYNLLADWVALALAAAGTHTMFLPPPHPRPYHSTFVWTADFPYRAS